MRFDILNWCLKWLYMPIGADDRPIYDFGNFFICQNSENSVYITREQVENMFVNPVQLNTYYITQNNAGTYIIIQDKLNTVRRT